MFSWATVPSFIHTSVLNDADFCEHDLAVLARFPAVTIEKWQACNSSVPSCYVPGPQSDSDVPNGTEVEPEPTSTACPTQQEAALTAAASIKALRPNASVFIWFDSLRIYSHRPANPDILDIEWQSCVNNAVSPYLESHPTLLLKNSSSGLAEEPYLRAHVYDHTQLAVREFWKQACLNMTSTGLIDGCGADASQQAGSYIGGLSPAVSAAWTAGHIAAVGNATQAVSAAGGLVLGKVEAQLGVSTNGVLQEGCVAGNATINTLLAAAAAAKRDGRRYVYECHSNGTPDDLAAFLIGASEDQYWGFGPWVYQTCGGAAASWIDELANPLGEPLGPATYSHPIWSRRFASNTAVTFDASTNKGTISWGTQAA